MSELVLTEIVDGCVTLTLNRPDARNALSRDVLEVLEQAVEAVGRDVSDGGVRVVMLTGAGSVFCAGMDLKSMRSDPPGMQPTLRCLARVMRMIRLLPVPTIACVQGAAIGAGCGLMVATDFTVTHPDAKIGYLEASLGLSPAVVAPWLIRKIGAGRARAMLLGGQTLSGREALGIGLVTHVVDRDRVATEAAELAARFTGGSADALATTKRWLNELEGHVSDDTMQHGADLSAEVLASPEAQSRLQKRFG
jgi:enoyl-CoA hydratase/carnithine racemase